MFENIGDFSLKRSPLQAGGFYLVSLLIGCLLMALIATVLVHINKIIIVSKGLDLKDNYSAGMAMIEYVIGPGMLYLVRILVAAPLSIAVIRAKKSYTWISFGGLALAIGLCFFNGALALLPVAGLTMLPKKQ